jgi:type II secretory pathway pseudopilin PulG
MRQLTEKFWFALSNMFGVARVPNPQSAIRNQQSGYTLVALLALMTLIALFAMAAAPSILQQAQREREKETIFRGEEVADAIREYYRYQGTNRRGAGPVAALPTSIDDLVEGVPIPNRTKKLQILRASAARDPLSTTGEWRLIKPNSPEILDFAQKVVVYAGNAIPPTSDPFRSLQQVMAPITISISGLTPTTPSSDAGLSDDSTGPFIGVSSRSKHNSVITYYGIDRHNEWVFTPFFR